MRLILNADDLGLTPGVNEGILRAHHEGVLTSATLMANGAAFEHAVDLARSTPTLGVGCHLVLVGGSAIAPASEIFSLVDSQGRLPASLPTLVARVTSGSIKMAHIETELRAQVAKIRKAGIEPTHFDTHKHTHVHPKVMEALGRVAEETGIRRVRNPIEKLKDTWATVSAREAKQLVAASAVRTVSSRFSSLARKYKLRTPDHFLGLGLTGRLGPQELLRLIETLPHGDTEIMLHPGICDADLAATGSRLQHQRELEMQALLDPDVKRAIAARGIERITYKDLG